MGATIQLSPSELEDWKRQAAAEFARQQIELLDVDELNTLPIETVASFLGISVARVARLFTVHEVGPRSRRIKLKDYKDYLARIAVAPTA